MKHFLSLFKGRINRRTYLLGYLLASLVATLIQIQAFMLIPSHLQTIILWIDLLILLIVIIMFFSLVTRRAHDIGLGSKWFLIFLLFIPIANFIMLLYLLLATGEDKENRFVPKPQAKTVFPFRIE